MVDMSDFEARNEGYIQAVKVWLTQKRQETILKAKTYDFKGNSAEQREEYALIMLQANKIDALLEELK